MSQEMTEAQAAALRAAVAETWALYSIGTLAICMRVFSRTRLVGIQGYKPDDYLIWFGWVCYTAMTVAAHIVGGTGDTSHLTDEQRLNMSEAEAAKRQSGTKWFLVGWYTYIGLIWTLKINMLFLYRRVAGPVWVSKLIVPTMAAVAASGVAIWILLGSACQPFQKMWQIYPDPGPTCYPQAPVYLITILTLNLSTDVAIVLMPIPILVTVRISWSRKIGLAAMFCASIFIMVAAILRVYFVLVEQKGETAAIWSCREDVVAVVVGQATMLRPLFTSRFWNPQAGTGSDTYATDPSSGNKYNKRSGSGQHLSGSNGGGGGFELRPSRVGFSKVKDPYNISVLHTRQNESEEDMIDRQEQQGHDGSDQSSSSVDNKKKNDNNNNTSKKGRGSGFSQKNTNRDGDESAVGEAALPSTKIKVKTVIEQEAKPFEIADQHENKAGGHAWGG